MIRYRVTVPPELAAVLAHLPPTTKRKLHASLRLLESTPHAGKPLVQELAGHWSYPIHPYRIVYRIDGARRLIRVVIVAPRPEVYDLLLHRLRTAGELTEQIT